MSRNSKIEWTDDSWTPIRARNVKTGKIGWHCEKVSPGCTGCYAESMNLRLGTRDKYVPSGDVEVFLDEKMLTAPLRWRKPRKVFVCSMTDLFASFVPDEWIDRMFAVMALSPQHTFQVLTKRSGRMQGYLAFEHRMSRIAASIDTVRTPGAPTGWHGWPIPNIWVGVSAEDQKRLDERAPDLLATPAAVRVVSAEPLLSGLSFKRYFPTVSVCQVKAFTPEAKAAIGDIARAVLRRGGLGSIDQVILGGESGARARPCDVSWIRSIVRQCREAGVACFVKQVGRWVSGSSEGFTGIDRWLFDGRVHVSGRNSTPPENYTAFHLFDAKGGNPYHWPEDLRVREFPQSAGRQ